MDSFTLNIILSIALISSLVYGYWRSNRSYQQGLHKGAENIKNTIRSILRKENIL